MLTKAVAQATNIVGAGNAYIFNSQQKAVNIDPSNVKSTNSTTGVITTNDGYEVRGTIVNISVCSTVDVDQTVTIEQNFYGSPAGSYFPIEFAVPLSIGANAVMELTGVCLGNDITLRASCTEGVDIYVYGLADLGVA